METKIKQYDIAIIGGGIVGLSAAIYAGRLDLKTVLFAKNFRGTLAKTDMVENYPGFKKISGLDLTSNILEHAKQYDPTMIEREVQKIRSCKTCFKISTKKESVSAKNILFATGTAWRKLNVLGEAKFSGKGVHTCGMCDGPFYKDKILAVVGGGDSAAKEALLLSQYAKKVYMLIRSTLKAEPVHKERISKDKKIKVLEGYQIKEIKGNKKVNSVTLDKEYNGSSELVLDGIFVDIGHIPLSQLAVKLGVKTNKKGEIIIDKTSKTNVEGIWAAGDVADAKYKQAITGVGESIKAIYDIYERVTGKEVICSCSNENL